MSLKFKILNKMGALLAIMLGMVSVMEAVTLYPYGTSLLTGDHAFPGLMGILLVISGIFLLFEKVNVTNNQTLPKGKVKVTMLSTIAILFLYCIVMEYVGYVVSTFLAIIILLILIGNYKWMFSAMVATIFTAALYFLFIILLKTPLPNGYFHFF